MKQQIQGAAERQKIARLSFQSRLVVNLHFVSLVPRKTAFGNTMKKVSSSYKSSWSRVEDELLVKAVAKWGPHDWYQIASEMPGRLPRQCRERYKNHVRQGINTAPFTREEDAIILTAQGW